MAEVQTSNFSAPEKAIPWKVLWALAHLQGANVFGENTTEETSTNISNRQKLLMIQTDRNQGQERVVDIIKQELNRKEIDRIMEYQKVYQKHEYLDHEYIFDYSVNELKLFLKHEYDCSISDFDKLDEMKAYFKSKLKGVEV